MQQKIFSIAAVLILFVIYVTCDTPFDTLLTFLNQGSRQRTRNFPDDVKLRKSYDFIVVGAGSAGSVLANRLTENPKWNVLLIEAGDNENLLMDVPMFVHYLQGYNVNWKYKTERSESYCLAMINNQCHWPRGKVMGGSSVLNYMVYTRGHHQDYDNWASLGNDGWDFNNVSYYFNKLENNQADDIVHNYHGNNGPVTVSSIKYKTDASRAFVQAGLEKGFPFTDYNGPNQNGFSFLQATVAHGARQSTNVAYLYPIAYRKNLHVKKNSHVTKLLIDDNNRVYGVKFFSRGKFYDVQATREVILSAGAINTPQILMLSGIGPRKHLSQMGIDTIVNLAVGYNLMDHIAPGSLTYKVDENTSFMRSKMFSLDVIDEYVYQADGPISSAGGIEAIAFADTKNPKNFTAYPDLELLFIGSSINLDPMLQRNFALRDDIYNKVLSATGVETNTFMIFPMILRPKSRGRIKLRSNNPFESPKIFPNYYSDVDNYDVETTVRSIRFMTEIINSESFRKIGAEYVRIPLPKCDEFEYQSDDYWECYSRHFTFTIYHHCGTAKMGPSSDRRAVVDPTLKVYGVKGLRVVDASIMPVIVSGHTNAPTIMIAEKAADMIKSDWRFK